MVHDLLDTARLEEGLFDVNKRPLDLIELVTQTVADMALLGRAQIHAQVDELIVSADPTRLRQVLENVLSNAWSVQPECEPVVVELDACQFWATVSIADRGPGIAAEVQATLFQRFGRGSRSVGLGLGLYLARGIAEAHGGSLEVESSMGGGARFIVRLPLEQVPQPDAEVTDMRPSGQDDDVGVAGHNGTGGQPTIADTNRPARRPSS
jgi:signal transduction histidine kinase